MTDPEDFSAQQRSALALWLLLQSPMSTREIADRCGLKVDSAREMLYRMSCVVPLHYNRREWWVNGREST